MIKIYISGRISGMEDEAVLLFEAAEQYLIGFGYEVVNPLKVTHNHDKSWINYMKIDLIEMLMRYDFHASQLEI